MEQNDHQTTQILNKWSKIKQTNQVKYLGVNAGRFTLELYNIYILFYDIQAPGLHTIQYWNIYKVVVILVNNNNKKNKKQKKNYLHRGSCTPCGKMTHKENLEQSQNHF